MNTEARKTGYNDLKNKILKVAREQLEPTDFVSPAIALAGAGLGGYAGKKLADQYTQNPWLSGIVGGGLGAVGGGTLGYVGGKALEDQMPNSKIQTMQRVQDTQNSINTTPDNLKKVTCILGAIQSMAEVQAGTISRGEFNNRLNRISAFAETNRPELSHPK